MNCTLVKHLLFCFRGQWQRNVKKKRLNAMCQIPTNVIIVLIELSTKVFTKSLNVTNTKNVVLV